MQTDLFDFELPDALVALRPANPRDSARLLVVHPDGLLEHRRFSDITGFFNNGDVLSFNDSRVILARLEAMRPAREPGGAGAAIEVTLLKRIGADAYTALVKPARRLRDGDRLDFADRLQATVTSRDGGEVSLRFNCGAVALDRAIAAVGAMPLPPYIAKRRAPDTQDMTDYQTVYAKEDGSVAAPTAGLHFTPGLLDRIGKKGVALAPLTLHVGAGTFLPVASEDTADHVMHAEQALLTGKTAARINAAHDGGGRLCAVGTTALRTLESAAGQDGRLGAFDAETAIFITPGYRFRAVDMLVTNFHLPRSTLFMLVCAFMGLDAMQAAYAEAIRQQYRFYSYGDACLLIRPR